MTLAQKTDLICSTYSKYQLNDDYHSTHPVSIFSGVDVKESGPHEVDTPHYSTDRLEGDDEYQMLTSMPVKEETERSVYALSLSSSLHELEDVEKIEHYVSDASCIENDFGENSHQNDELQPSHINNWPQQIDYNFTLKRANPVYDEDSDSEFEQEEHRRTFKRNKTLDFVSMELYMEDNCIRDGHCALIQSKRI